MALGDFQKRGAEVIDREGIGLSGRGDVVPAVQGARSKEYVKPLTAFALALALGGLATGPTRAADETNPDGSLPKGDLVPPTVYTMSPTGVSLADGSFIYSNVDLEIGTLKLERFYSGTSGVYRDPADQFHGLRQSNSFDIYVNPMYSITSFDYTPPRERFARTTVHMGAATSGEFFQWDGELAGPDASITRQTDDMKGQSLALDDGNYRYQDESGTLYYFDKTKHVVGITGAQNYTQFAQRISSVQYPDGRVRSFQYIGTSADPKLKVVTDSTGYAIVFDWNATGQISAACAFKLSEQVVSTATTCAGALMKVSYGYTAITPTWTARTRYVLTSFTDVLGNVTSYQFSSQGWVTCITPPTYSVCKIQNNYVSDTELIQTTADGGQWHYSWGTEGEEPRDNASEAPMAMNWGGFMGPNSFSTGFAFFGTTPTLSWDANGNETQYVYAGGHKFSDIPDPVGSPTYGRTLMSVTFPEGNRYDATYSPSWGQLTKETWTPKPGSVDGPLIRNYQYGQLDPINRFQATRVQDPNGNWTDFTYEAHGGIATEMGPAPAANGARPLKVTAWVQRNAWVKNASGVLVQVTPAIWVKASETQCQTLAGPSPAATCDPAAPKMITAYEYGANGQSLLVKGVAVTADGLTLRTCYGYDVYDRKISGTEPNGTSTSCP